MGPYVARRWQTRFYLAYGQRYGRNQRIFSLISPQGSQYYDGREESGRV